MFLYIIYALISPILWLIVLVISFFNIKIGDHWNQLWISINSIKKDIKNKHPNKQILLFHAASAGEFEQLIPILKSLDKKKYYIVQSFFSPTIYNKISQKSYINHICYHPFDFILSSLLFFKKINPDYYIITRHDIWPSHIFIANLLNIKTILINANLYSNSMRIKFPFFYFNQWIFNFFHKILTPSKRIKNNIELLIDKKNIICTGDSRFDRIKTRMLNNNLALFPKKINETKNIIFGSIIDSDYNIVFEALKNYFINGNQSLKEKKIRLIIVPHETDDKTILNLETKLQKIKLEPIRFDKVDKLIPEVIIINKVGILADLYKYSDLVYIGGGFGAGVHSVIEPAIYGSIVTYGPNIHILDEAVEMTNEKIGFIVNNFSEMTEYFKLLNDQSEVNKIQKETKLYIEKKIGASEKIINELFN